MEQARRNRTTGALTALLALLMLLGAFIGIDMGIRPMVKAAAASQTQIAVNRMIQRAVLEVLEEDGLRYQSFVTLRQNQNQYIRAHGTLCKAKDRSP